jgi:hypothetical protein
MAALSDPSTMKSAKKNPIFLSFDLEETGGGGGGGVLRFVEVAYI